ncbi:ABC transporter B family member 3-like isoform X1 [Syzygium oleosum]|uniref:ABC transporter B family member 3-like isoform X1 n=1 Tax=Syzygium oleosum TaxID=219896 RepID=UPI0011D2BAC7|nr:ABC transporter B family member 3-like isoform X1 [Syzygium oleosum]XP_056165325.1 ABC transporter B family member 3-like isoform X1 [Syzygium oleosum]XP_056165326.1 ABC transporter B family member 3-like isoform X1 [Syzygium oleosum]
MANEKDADEHSRTYLIDELTSRSPVLETAKQDSSDSEDKEDLFPRVPFYKLFLFADPVDYVLMLAGSIAAVGSGISMPLMTLFFGQLVNSFGDTGNTKEGANAVSKVCLKLVYLAVGSGVAAFTQVACWMVTGERQAARIRSLYLKALLRQEIGFFDKETNTGEIIGRMSGDTVLIQDAMGEKVGKFIQQVAIFFGGFAIAFIKGWLLTLVMLASIPLLILSSAVFNRTLAKLASRGQTSYSQAAAVVEQTVGSIRTVASFTGEKQAIARYKESMTKAYQSGVHEGLVSGMAFGTLMFVVFCTYALAVWFGGKMILEKGYTGGDIVNVVLGVLSGSTALGQASPCMSAFAAGQAAALKLFEAINRKPQIDAYDPSGRTLDNIHGDIELRDVYFSYPSRPNEQIFSGFSLSIPSGTTTALVGESGSGKSTVISLIERFYDPDAGEVLMDGINLKELQLKWIRQKIGLVSQEPVLFTSSIGENIAYGKEGVAAEEIRAAAELANATEFIDKLPQGIDTMVGEHGTQLSGGQKQRVAIARAILKDPRILLLDEATSALDVESERIVQEALDRIMADRTTVIVAHRLSTIRNANTIAVIHHGKIVERGSHSELVKDCNGAYSQLIRLQEIASVSEQKETVNLGEQEIAGDSLRNSSRRMSFRRSISQGSLTGSTSHRLFSDKLTNNSCSETTKSLRNVSLRRVAYLNKPEIPVLVLGTLAAAASGAIFPMFSILISGVIKTFNEPPHELREGTKFWALIFLALGSASLLVHPMKSYFFTVAGCKLIARVRTMCFKKVVHMEISWFDEVEHSSGAIGARLSADAAALKILVGDALGLIVQNIATAIAGFAIAFVTNWQLAFIILSLFPFFGINGYVQMKFMAGFSTDAKKMYEEASQVANDAVGSIRTVASFCAEERVMDLYRRKCESPMKKGIRQGLISGIGFGSAMFFLYAVFSCSFYAGARLVEQGKMKFSDVFRVLFALEMASVGITQLSSIFTDAANAKGSAASILEILDRKSIIDPGDDSGITIENLKGEIVFDHVGFSYPTRPNVQIFQDLCLAIPSSKTVALVGESGSGKSTVISLLQRFYDPDAGNIMLDGIEIRKLQLKWLRHQMGLVSQEPVLFNDTIRANIAYGKEGIATEAEIVAAAELANANGFISSLQQGYDTIVGERGIQLSGGQKQRVAIARAIVKAPKVLLLDEATSALDAESERVVQDALDQVMVNRTTIVVAHRLSTIKGADMIAVVKNGVITEQGKHKSLITIKDGVYASMVALHSSTSSK